MRLRSLAAVTFVVLFAAILTLLLGFVFRDPLQLLGDNHAWSAQIVLPPPAHAQFGKPFQTGTLLRVVNFKGNGVRDATVTMTIGRVRAPMLGLDIDCTTLEPTLLNLQYRFVCDAGITGDQAKSGSAGFALINNTVISTGLVGTYNLSFTAESVSTHAIVTMQSNVLAVQLIGQAVPSSIAAGEIVEFTVQAVAEDGTPAEGRRLVIVASSFSPGDLESLGISYVPDYRSDKFGIIENLGDVQTNESGMAHVRMRWKAANYAYQYPILICERAVLPLYPSFSQPTMITTNVSKVVVVREPPSRVEEKVPFSAVVGVYDADGKPLQGKYVMAQISLFAGAREAPYLPVPRANPAEEALPRPVQRLRQGWSGPLRQPDLQPGGTRRTLSIHLLLRWRGIERVQHDRRRLCSAYGDSHLGNGGHRHCGGPSHHLASVSLRFGQGGTPVEGKNHIGLPVRRVQREPGGHSGRITGQRNSHFL